MVNLLEIIFFFFGVGEGLAFIRLPKGPNQGLGPEVRLKGPPTELGDVPWSSGGWGQGVGGPSYAP